MPKLNLQDLVVRLDEGRRVLQFLVPKGQSSPEALRVFYEISADDVDEGDVTLEHQLGVALLSFLSSTYQSSEFHLDDYRDAAQDVAAQLQPELLAELVEQSNAGDAAAKYRLAMHHVAAGLRKKSRASMHEAETLLQEAAKLGNAEAKDYLSNLWPPLKERSDRTFKS
ncbi:MAG TPA: hypothetical protein VFR86_28190 [Burkholderiaceae bacterium]|nr:hypothetical protein [Burkholderiaceae bacterium]